MIWSEYQDFGVVYLNINGLFVSYDLLLGFNEIFTSFFDFHFDCLDAIVCSYSQ